MAEPLLAIVRATKRFGDCLSVDGADLRVFAGRIHAVVGENGAGKTTLLKMGAGQLVPTAGHVEVDGRRLEPHTPREALRRGVGMVAQHFSLVPTMTGLENVMLGAEPVRALGALDFAAARARVARVADELGTALELDVPVRDLDIGARQRLEIARVLYRDARVVILDEPTAVLTWSEAEALYRTLRRLADAGRAVVVVTHKLGEVRAHADAVTVLRRGRVVSSRHDFGASRDVDELAKEIMGEEPPPEPPREARARGDVVLELEGVRLRRALTGLSLAVHAGEIVGVCGVEGNGQAELVRTCAGLEPEHEGKVRVVGPRPAIVMGDRQREGLVLGATVEENLILGELGDATRAGLVDARRVRALAAERMRRAGVVPARLDAPVRSLSGGNQQKIVVERACARADRGARVLVALHPTRGVDLAAARAIHGRLVETASRGVGVLVISADLDELRALSDRLLVLRRGRIVAEVEPTTPVARLGELMLGEAS